LQPIGKAVLEVFGSIVPLPECFKSTARLAQSSKVGMAAIAQPLAIQVENARNQEVEKVLTISKQD
jgi:hypothetical protein